MGFMVLIGRIGFDRERILRFIRGIEFAGFLALAA